MDNPGSTRNPRPPHIAAVTQYERALEFVNKKYPHFPFKSKDKYEDNLLDLPYVLGTCSPRTYDRIIKYYDGHCKTEHDGTAKILIWELPSGPHDTTAMVFSFYVNELLGTKVREITWGGGGNLGLIGGTRAPDEQGISDKVRREFNGPDDKIPFTTLIEVDLHVSGLPRITRKCDHWLSCWSPLQLYFGLGVFCPAKTLPGTRIVLIYAHRSDDGNFEIETHEVGTRVPRGAPPPPKFLKIPLKLLFHGDPDYANNEEVLEFDLEEWMGRVRNALRLK